jgi:phenylpyruvate tautomerase PptA (4-oxalocrotonate tautomerase family)
MPHLVIRGVAPDRLQEAAPQLVEQLSELCQCGTDNFTINIMHTTAVWGGPPQEPPFAFVEVGWFERGTAVRDRFARIVTDTLSGLGMADVEVVFVAYREEDYYINGVAVSAK